MNLHPQAICESTNIGPDTNIWAFAHVMSGARIGANCNIGAYVFVESGARIGDSVTIKNGVQVWSKIYIGNGVFIGPGAVFSNDRYPRSRRFAAIEEIGNRYSDENNWIETMIIGEGATIGAGAIILPGVTIGHYAMVGAGALVTKDIGSHQLVTGRPATPVGWVCKAGYRLSEKNSGEFSCNNCGRNLPVSGKQPDFHDGC